MQSKEQIRKTKIYIDGANLHTALKYSGHDLDYAKFFTWLTEEFKTKDIFLFLGYIKSHKNICKRLEDIGYILVFKKTLRSKGKIKGNCDAELVLKAVADITEVEFTDLILVSSDGDFACLLEFAKQRGKYVRVISPSQKLSYLIRKMNIDITWVQEMVHRWEKN